LREETVPAVEDKEDEGGSRKDNLDSSAKCMKEESQLILL
jgi:hypothetical protein